MRSALTRSLDHKFTSLRRAREVKPRPVFMSSFSHLFQDQAQSYAEFRPSYPKELYDILFEYISKDSPMEHALDIATGSGQAAVELAKKFEKVTAIDASEGQLKHAIPHPKIEYRLGLAEGTGVPDHSLDLVASAQAMHWFDHPRYFKEVHRILKPGGTLANWGYALPTVKGDKASSDLIREFAYGDSFLGPYWEARRKYVDEEYASIHPDPELFEDVKRERFPSYTDCTVEHFMNNLGTFSAYNTYRRQHPDREDPLLEFKKKFLKSCGKSDVSSSITIAWTIFIMLTRARN